jgi:hypothetical protein
MVTLLMMVSFALVCGVFDVIASEEFPPAPRRPSAVGQDAKVVAIAKFVLGQLFRTGSCSVDEVDEWAAKNGLTGRCVLQLSVGVGGKSGLCLDMSAGSVLLVRENVGRLIKRLGAARFDDWLAVEGLTEEDFGAWFQKLPRAGRS